ncbi:MAG: FecR domain-containing protein [bacterium]|nr:FecR domain-containing protein [bacterium]
MNIKNKLLIGGLMTSMVLPALSALAAPAPRPRTVPVSSRTTAPSVNVLDCKKANPPIGCPGYVAPKTPIIVPPKTPIIVPPKIPGSGAVTPITTTPVPTKGGITIDTDVTNRYCAYKTDVNIEKERNADENELKFQLKSEVEKIKKIHLAEHSAAPNQRLRDLIIDDMDLAISRVDAKYYGLISQIHREADKQIDALSGGPSTCPPATTITPPVILEVESFLGSGAYVVIKGKTVGFPSDNKFALTYGDQIVVPIDGSKIVVSFPNGAIIALYPGSKLTVGESKFLTAGPVGINLFLNAGKIKITDTVVTSDKRQLNIFTTNATVENVHTRYIVTYDESKGQTYVAVQDGLVKVTPAGNKSKNGPINVNENQEVIVMTNGDYASATNVVAISEYTKKSFDFDESTPTPSPVTAPCHTFARGRLMVVPCSKKNKPSPGQGIQGKQGIQGVQGEQGVQGIQGPPGSPAPAPGKLNSLPIGQNFAAVLIDTLTSPFKWLFGK